MRSAGTTVSLVGCIAGPIKAGLPTAAMALTYSPCVQVARGGAPAVRSGTALKREASLPMHPARPGEGHGRA